MGIYISGVKGLPEQVQENKNKIKEVEEQIEGIDFEAVRQLQGQVAENTQDINNLEASIGVQNQAINGLKDRADALESKTQLITYNSDYGMTDFRNSIEVADDVYASNVRVMGDGSIVNTTQSGFHFKEGANDDTLTIANNDGATPHYLHFNADGTLDIDGSPVGAKPLYQHTIEIKRASLSAVITFTIINDSNTPFDKNAIISYLYNNQFNGDTSLYHASGFIYIGTDNGIVCGLFSNTSTNLTIYIRNITSNSYANQIADINYTITDKVVQIA